MWANDPEMAKKWEKKEKKMKREQRVRELIKKMVREELKKLDGKKIIFTNGSKKHALNVTQKIGIDHHFLDFLDFFFFQPASEP